MDGQPHPFERKPLSRRLKFAGRLFSTIVSHYQQANDCEHNHQQFEIAHKHHLPIHLSKNRGGTLPDIQSRTPERSNRPPFHGSATFIMAQDTLLIKSLGNVQHNVFNAFYKLCSCSPHSHCLQCSQNSQSLQKAYNSQRALTKQCITRVKQWAQ